MDLTDTCRIRPRADFYPPSRRFLSELKEDFFSLLKGLASARGAKPYLGANPAFIRQAIIKDLAADSRLLTFGSHASSRVSYHGAYARGGHAHVASTALGRTADAGLPAVWEDEGVCAV